MARDAAYISLTDGASWLAGSARGRATWSVAAVASIMVLACAFSAGRYSAIRSVQNVAALSTTLYSPAILPAFQGEPIAKSTLRRFDAYLMLQATYDDPITKLANVEQWLAPDFVYDSVGFPSSRTPRGWCVGGEEREYRRTFPTSVFTQMLFFGSDTMATTTSYGNVFWDSDLFGIPAPKAWVYFRVTDFYSARQTTLGRSQIYYNFMMIDFVGLFAQVGIHVLPPAPLQEGIVLPPSTNDGVPAPLSVVAKGRDSETARAVSVRALRQDWEGESVGTEAWHSNLIFYGCGGIGMAKNASEYEAHVLAPFRAAFARRKVDTLIFDCEGNYCGAFGTISGNHVAPWLGLEASGKDVALRFGMHWRVVEGRVQEGWAMFDLPGLFKQIGLDFFARAASLATSQRILLQ